jgi:hypothetical protein
MRKHSVLWEEEMKEEASLLRKKQGQGRTRAQPMGSGMSIRVSEKGSVEEPRHCSEAWFGILALLWACHFFSLDSVLSSVKW